MFQRWPVLPAFLVLLVFLTGVSLVPAQDRPSIPDSFKLTADSLDLPKGDGAWVVRVTRTGGFAGTTTDITVTSEGTLRCVPPTAACGGSLVTNTLQSFTQLVLPPVISPGESSLNSLCRDCFLYRITVRRRESTGRDQTYFAYWDDTTASKVPPELAQMFQAAIGLNR